jgi:predicted DNA-binding ribbon-helix-helix protein
MVRTQIQLTESQAEAVKRMAAERGLSMAAMIRELVERAISENGDRAVRIARARAAVGRYASGRSDIAREHDRELAEIYAE